MILPALLLPVLAGASAFTVTNAVYTGPVRRPADARLVWNDEFGGSHLDSSKWAFETAHNKKGWFNREKQYYSAGRAKNVRLRAGKLIIEAYHERLDPRSYPDWGGQEYTSGRLVSKGAWTYGFTEVRAKLPCARGTWPAIWMLPKRMEHWPQDGEIDIMEQVGAEPNVIYSTLHTGLFNHVTKTQRSAQKLVPSSCSAFHTYQLDWRPGSIIIGVDGKGILRVRDDQPGGKGAWPFTVPFDIILNLAIGGDWAGAKGIDDAALPERMTVDYVRVWQSPGGRPAR